MLEHIYPATPLAATDNNQIVLQADPQVDQSVVIVKCQVMLLMEIMAALVIQVVLM
tara:strand:- start:390 stop:557 length:168 start_codon:yes stop_codon:yes gene_type:complete